MQDATANDPKNELHYSLCTKNQKNQRWKKKKEKKDMESWFNKDLTLKSTYLTSESY